jgi:hypothetical protein
MTTVRLLWRGSCLFAVQPNARLQSGISEMLYVEGGHHIFHWPLSGCAEPARPRPGTSFRGCRRDIGSGWKRPALASAPPQRARIAYASRRDDGE